MSVSTSFPFLSPAALSIKWEAKLGNLFALPGSGSSLASWFSWGVIISNLDSLSKSLSLFSRSNISFLPGYINDGALGNTAKTADSLQVKFSELLPK